MQSINIVREKRLGFDERGHRVSSDETYVNISVSFRDLMQRLRGARLSVFLCLALNEAEISLGSSNGLSIYHMADESGYDARTVLRAVQYLCKFNFAVRLNQRGTNGEWLYRVADYAWFGGGTASGQPKPLAQAGYDKTSYLPSHANVIPPMTKDAHDDDVSTGTPEIENKQHHHVLVRDIFHTSGFRGKNLDELATRVSADNARAWCAWLPLAAQSGKYSNPIGYAFTILISDPTAPPPALAATASVESSLEIPEPAILGNGPAGVLWRDVLENLNLDNHWMQFCLQTRVLDYDLDAETIHLIVFDPSRFIVERLRAHIEADLRALSDRSHCELTVVSDKTPVTFDEAR